MKESKENAWSCQQDDRIFKLVSQACPRMRHFTNNVLQRGTTYQVAARALVKKIVRRGFHSNWRLLWRLLGLNVQFVDRKLRVFERLVSVVCWCVATVFQWARGLSLRGCAWCGCQCTFSARNLRTELARDLIVRCRVPSGRSSAVCRLLRRGRLAADGSRLVCLRRGYLHHLALLLFFKDTLSHVLLVICFCD